MRIETPTIEHTQPDTETLTRLCEKLDLEYSKGDYPIRASSVEDPELQIINAISWGMAYPDRELIEACRVYIDGFSLDDPVSVAYMYTVVYEWNKYVNQEK